ncbi:MAG: glycosyltransferase family 4 protein [Chitinophagaceae bacterium]
MANILSLVTFKIFPPQMGGQKGVALFYKYLSQINSIIIAGPSDNDDSHNNNIFLEKMLYSNKWIYLNIFNLRGLIKLMAKHKTDIIIAEHSYPAFIGWVLRKITSKPFIIHSHNMEAHRFQQMNKWWWRLYWHYERWIHRQADYNFFISEEDASIAVSQFKINRNKCMVIPYGVEKPMLYADAGAQLRKQFQLSENVVLFYFNGTLNYKPNEDAVKVLLEKIDPLLRKLLTDYRILITGKNLEGELLRKTKQSDNFIFCGYADDISIYYQGCAIFLNPVVNSSGIKTKVVEAIANNCTVVSTASGASGVPVEVCNNKLVVVADNDWQKFVEQAVAHAKQKTPTPASFYDYFYWPNLADKASNKINDIVKHNG